MPVRRFWILTLAAAVTGVALRCWYVLDNRWAPGVAVSDPRTFHRLGQVLAAGRGYIRPNEYLDKGLVIPTAEFPPVYPLLLAALDLAGIDGPTEQRLAGALLGGVTVVVIALLADAVGGRTVGVTAAVIAALYPQLVVFDGSLLSEGPYVLLVATTLLGVVRARSAAAEDRLRWWLLAGAALGCAALTRSEALLLVPLLVVPATRTPGDARAWARTALVASAGTMLLLGAWTVRNAVTLGHFLPLTNNSGTMLAGANCDAVYRGVQIGGWRFDCVEGVDYAVVSETDANADRRAAGLDYMRAHADELPAVVAARIGRTFGVWDVRVNLFFESLEGRDYDWLWAGWYAWIVLAPLAAAGTFVHRRAGREVWPLLVPVAAVLVTTIVSYGNQRFRSMAEPSIVVLAAIGTVAVARGALARIGGGRAVDVVGAPPGESAGESAGGSAGDQAQAPGGSS